jgi:hypothetical protein
MTKENAEKLNRESALHNGNNSILPIKSTENLSLGLTKREYIAIQLMAASMTYGHTQEAAAQIAVKGAESLLFELSKNNS